LPCLTMYPKISLVNFLICPVISGIYTHNFAQISLVGGIPTLWKIMEFVRWDDEIPKLNGKS
jgi:hypothetical protein